MRPNRLYELTSSLFICLPIALLGCGTLVLKADFDSERVGLRGPGSLPEDPRGDRFTFRVEDEPPPVAVVDGDAAIWDRSLKLTDSDPTPRPLFFVSKDLGTRRQKYRAMWVGRIRWSPDFPPFFLRCTFGNLTSGVAYFGIRGTEIVLRRGRGWEPVGDIEYDMDHLVSIVIDDEASTFMLSILLPDGRPMVQAGPIPLGPYRGTSFPDWPVLDPVEKRFIEIWGKPLSCDDYFRRLHISFYFRSSEPSHGAYVMDHVRIWSSSS